MASTLFTTPDDTNYKVNALLLRISAGRGLFWKGLEYCGKLDKVAPLATLAFLLFPLRCYLIVMIFKEFT